MIHEIREAFNDLLEDNEWMDTETRAVAKDKANSMNERIGYPEYITNTSRLEREYDNVSFNSGPRPVSRFWRGNEKFVLSSSILLRKAKKDIHGAMNTEKVHFPFYPLR